MIRSIIKNCPKFIQITRNISVLGIECSCDDTSVGVVNSNRQVLAESKYNQWMYHKKLGHSKRSSNLFSGGIVPNIARLLHHENLIPAVSDCIEQLPNKWNDINAIALTVKPGLEPCLWEGIQFTKLILKKHKLPFIPIHHMEAHALVAKLDNPNIEYPFLTLLISGGHCLLAVCENENNFLRLGTTIDIAPGNFIDKLARKLGLFNLESLDNNLSGGALIELMAGPTGDPYAYKAIIRMVENYCRQNKNCDFSFSGFLSALHRLIDQLYKAEDNKILNTNVLSNICATIQHLIAIQLEDRLKRAIKFCNLRNINIKHTVIAGGVASNLYIKSYLEKLTTDTDTKLSIPPVRYCTDNGVMIAWNGVLVCLL